MGTLEKLAKIGSICWTGNTFLGWSYDAKGYFRIIFFVIVNVCFLSVGKRIMVVNGGYRGTEAVLESINERKFSCTVTLKQVSQLKEEDLEVRISQ